MRAQTASSWSRVILHADMDAFYAAIEQQDNPSLRGHPVLVGGPRRRGVVSTASYEARPFGVGSAMSMAEALRRCPEAVVVRPRFDRYKEISNRIMKVFERFAVEVEAISLDEAFLDMTGAEGLFGTPEAMGRQVKAAVRETTGGLTVSVGVATTKFLAKVASDQDKPDGLTVVPPGQVLEFLHPLPVSRLWGVGPKTERVLHDLGLRTIGQVAGSDPRWLSKRLGALGRHLYKLSHNDDSRTVVTSHRARSVGAELTLSQNVRGADAIRPHLLTAADRVARRLRKKRLRAYGVRVKLKTHRFELHTRQIRLPDPTEHADTLYRTALAVLPRFDLRPPMRLVGMAAYDLISADLPVQGDLFREAQLRSETRLDHALDDLRRRFGDAAVGRASDGNRTTGDLSASTGDLLDGRSDG